MGLGSASIVTLAEASEKAREHAKAAIAYRHGEADLDPIAKRRAAQQQRKQEAAKSISFQAAAEAYIAAHQAGWRNPKHSAQWPASLKMYVYPVLGDLPVAAVDTGLVMKCIEPIWSTKPETASRVRGRIESVLDWAKARGCRQGENPARWKGHLDNLLPAPSKAKRAARVTTGREEHHAALPFTAISEFMLELQALQGVAARALEFAILTAARTGEVIGATWDEINVAEKLWTIPGERMKAGREHRVPLSDAAAMARGRRPSQATRAETGGTDG
jgi:integrase